jgi:DNA-binding MarR family transcriptional regulator
MSRESAERLEQSDGPEPSPERQQLYAELGGEVRASQRATDIVDDLVCELLGINRTDARCLDILEQDGSMSAGDLAQASRLTTGAITAVIDRLERAGYARRVPDPADRRRVLVEPTPQAFATANELMVEPMRRLYGPIAARYSDEELRMFIEFTREGREIQERHAEWLRARLDEQRGL